MVPSYTCLSRQAIAKTEALIRPYIRNTPVITVEASDFGLLYGQLAFKLEFLQHSGSFKARGAFANLLGRTIPAAGVVAASGGNHGAAVAYAAHKLGISAHIFVSSVISPAKADRIRQCGAKLVVVGERYADALAASEQFAIRSGALPVHAFEQEETMLGQGTIGIELARAMPAITTLLVAVGGGGLIGGIAAWFEDRVKLIAVEPEGSPTLRRAFEAGEPVDAETSGIAADSLAPRRVGQLMFPLAQSFVKESLLVSDADIVEAQRILWDRLRIVVEPGGAAAFAALLSRRYQPSRDETVAVLLCGANTTAVNFS